ncbi:MAG: uroporphyrinogen decarboxylase family protein [Bacteroidota bacterium]|jgi:uroporphyrinogen decarboxylase
MTSRERIRRIIDGKPADRCGFWLGNPHPDTLPIYHKYFGTSTLDELQLKVGDDFRWITPLFIESTYQHPEGKGIFDLWKYKKSLGEPGPLSECESLNEVESYDWPDVKYIDLTECLLTLRNAGEFYRASGFWTPFFHDVMDIFGAENYLTKMYTHPEIVHAVTDHVCGFYYAANELLFAQAGDSIDGYFFGNDFGTQRDLILAPELFDEFVLPWFQRFTDQAQRHGYQVILHSCGSIYRVIGRLIDAGVNCLHPLQARAANMDAETLAREFGGRISFLGGIDTQDVLVNAGQEGVKKEVRRIKSLLGPRLIVSPSHEALLPNVPPENVVAMAEAALE